jgi:hypothetical protein
MQERLLDTPEVLPQSLSVLKGTKGTEMAGGNTVKGESVKGVPSLQDISL